MFSSIPSSVWDWGGVSAWILRWEFSYFAEWSFPVPAPWWESDKTGWGWDHPEEFSVNKSCQCSVPCSLEGSVWRRVWLSVTSWPQQETTTNLNLARSRLGRSSDGLRLSPLLRLCVSTAVLGFSVLPLPSLCCKKENLLIVTLQDIHAPWWSLTRIPVSSAAPQQSIMMANLMTCYFSKAINAPSQASLSSSTSITEFPQNLSVPHSLTAVHSVSFQVCISPFSVCSATRFWIQKKRNCVFFSPLYL